jgi:hypothetical protein
MRSGWPRHSSHLQADPYLAKHILAQLAAVAPKPISHLHDFVLPHTAAAQILHQCV